MFAKKVDLDVEIKDDLNHHMKLHYLVPTFIIIFIRVATLPGKTWNLTI